MPEHIYLSTGDGTLEALKENSFRYEEEFQSLIGRHPELLDGEQIAPGAARRWILIKPEMGIAEAPGQSNKWALDLLLIDQDGIPTLAELKRASNKELRRTVIGQVLEYASHAAVSWTAEDLRDAFERCAAERGANAQEELATLLQSQGEPPQEDFWNRVATNLKANRMRLLFVADHIPGSLARTVEFLNEQMKTIEVLAVEIKQFGQNNRRTLVPKIIGRTSAAYPKSTHPKQNRKSFLEAFERDDVRDAAKRLLEVAEGHGAEIYFGSTGLSIRARSPAWTSPMSIAWLYPHKQAGWMNTREFSFGEAISDYYELPDGLVKTLNDWVQAISGWDIAENASSKGVNASSINHNAAAGRIDDLARELQEVLKNLAALQ